MGEAGEADTAARGRARLLVAAVVLGTVVLRGGLLHVVHSRHPDRAVTNDTPSYVDSARALLDDGEFDVTPGSATPQFVRTPGYPAFVAVVYWLFDGSDHALVLAQAVLGGLSVWLAILLARRVTGSLALSLAVGIVLALDPVQAWADGLILTEALATVLTTATAYCAVRLVQSGFRPGWGAACGLALAAATFVRPTTYYFVPLVAVLLVVLLVRNRPNRIRILGAGAAVLVPCVVFLGAWDLRNHQTVDSWRFSGIEGINTYWYRAADVLADRDGTLDWDKRVELTEALNRYPGYRFTYGEERGVLPPAWVDRQGEYYDRAQADGLAILRSEPVFWGRQVATGIYSQLVQAGWQDAYELFTSSKSPWPVTGVGLAVVWTIEALAVTGMAISLRKRSDHRAAHAFLIALVAYVILASTGPEASLGYRFKVPLWPIYLLYAAIGVRHLHRARTRETTDPDRPSSDPTRTASGGAAHRQSTGEQ